jgi:hypothetical protein
MKLFRVELTSLGTTFVEADSYTQDDDFLRFYRGGVLLAEYLPRTVKKVEEIAMAAREGLFSVLSPISAPSP